MTVLVKDIRAIQTPYLYLENIKFHKKELLMVREVAGNTQLFSQTTRHEKLTSAPFGSTYIEGPTYVESQPPTVIYVVIKTGQIHEITRKSFTETAWFLFKDCAYVAESILNKENKYEDMARIVTQYNACIKK